MDPHGAAITVSAGKGNQRRKGLGETAAPRDRAGKRQRAGSAAVNGGIGRKLNGGADGHRGARILLDGWQRGPVASERQPVAAGDGHPAAEIELVEQEPRAQVVGRCISSDLVEIQGVVGLAAVHRLRAGGQLVGPFRAVAPVAGHGAGPVEGAWHRPFGDRHGIDLGDKILAGDRVGLRSGEVPRGTGGRHGGGAGGQRERGRERRQVGGLVHRHVDGGLANDGIRLLRKHEGQHVMDGIQGHPAEGQRGNPVGAV